MKVEVTTKYSKKKLNLSPIFKQNGLDIQNLIGFDEQRNEFVNVASIGEVEYSNDIYLVFKHGYYPKHKLGLKALKYAKKYKIKIL